VLVFGAGFGFGVAWCSMVLKKTYLAVAAALAVVDPVDQIECGSFDKEFLR
jgi:hypothetical protein